MGRDPLDAAIGGDALLEAAVQQLGVVALLLHLRPSQGRGQCQCQAQAQVSGLDLVQGLGVGKAHARGHGEGEGEGFAAQRPVGGKGYATAQRHGWA